MFKILVVEDDKNLNRMVCKFLNDNGYTATGCLCVNDAYNVMYDMIFDLIISDIMMPDISGFEFAEAVRGIDNKIPIMFVTAKDDFLSKQKGFRMGIDDYMVKPIDPNELVLHVGALLRRAGIANEKKITVGKLTLDADGPSAVYGGCELQLTVREFNILYKLLSYLGKTFSRSQLMNEFWEMDTDTTLRSVDVYISRLREAILRSQRCMGLDTRRCCDEKEALCVLAPMEMVYPDDLFSACADCHTVYHSACVHAL